MKSKFTIIMAAVGFLVQEKDESGFSGYHMPNGSFTDSMHQAIKDQFTNRSDAVQFIRDNLDPSFEKDLEKEAEKEPEQKAKVIYSDMVAALKKDPKDIIDSLLPEKADAIHMAIGIVGEAGELIDNIKKWTIYNKPLDRDNLIEELGDIEFFMEGLRQIFGITRDETLEANQVKLLTGENARYKMGKYTDAQAHARADKVSVHITNNTDEAFDVKFDLIEFIDHVPLNALDVTTLDDLANRNKRWMIDGKEYLQKFNGTNPIEKDDPMNGQAVS